MSDGAGGGGGGVSLPGNDKGVADMIALDELSSQSISANLRRRFEAQCIYTYTGSVAPRCARIACLS